MSATNRLACVMVWEQSKRSARASLPAVLCVLLVLSLACAQQAPNRHVDGIEDILGMVSDDSMRALWQSAHDAGQLPDLATLSSPDELVTDRQRSTIAASPVPSSRPKTPSAVAHAEMYSRVRLPSHYDGSFDLLRHIDSEAVRGRISGHRADVELLYTLPGQAGSLPDLRSRDLRLFFATRLAGLVAHRSIHLRDTSNSTVLFYHSDGSNLPLHRRLQAPLPAIEIRQLAPDSLGVPRVEVSDRAGKVVLAVGRPARVRLQTGVLEVVLLSNIYAEPSDPQVFDGERFSVCLMMYEPRH